MPTCMPAIVSATHSSVGCHAGNIASWKKKEGEEVAAGDSIAEIETDKVNPVPLTSGLVDVSPGLTWKSWGLFINSKSMLQRVHMIPKSVSSLTTALLLHTGAFPREAFLCGVTSLM